MESTPLAETKGVPDRAVINKEGRVQLTNPVTPVSPISPNSPTHHSLKNSLDERRHSAAAKVRKVLHIRKPSDTPTADPILASDSAAKSHRSRLGNDLPDPSSISVDGLLHHPIDTIKDKISAQSSQQAAANIATKEISHGQEVKLVQAEDRVQDAATGTERAIAGQERDDLIRERQNIYVRWTMDRHVAQCRVMPKDIGKKSRSDFEHKTLDGDIAVDWKAYGTHVRSQLSSRKLTTTDYSPACGILRSTIRWSICWLRFEPARINQRIHHAQCRANSHRICAFPKVCDEDETDLQMGRSNHDINCPFDLHGVGLLQSFATRDGKMSIFSSLTKFLTTIIAIAVWHRLYGPKKALCRQDTRRRSYRSRAY